MTLVARKLLTYFLFLLFISIAVAPSINFTVVKASDDNDLVEVTSQTCGIQGFGNTTVKLTKEQYQNLEQYLVDFRARLNQTSTREEAVPIFKDAVVELHKYGLLPKEMSVEQAQRLVLGPKKEKNHAIFNQRLQNIISKNDLTNYNFLCLLAGSMTANSIILGPFFSMLLIIFNMLTPFGFLRNSQFATNFYTFIAVGGFVYGFLNPIDVLSIIYIGSHIDSNPSPTNGTIWSYGLLGIKKWNGWIMGALGHPYLKQEDFIFFETDIWHSGVIGFTGIDLISERNFFFGTALALGISYE